MKETIVKTIDQELRRACALAQLTYTPDETRVDVARDHVWDVICQERVQYGASLHPCPDAYWRLVVRNAAQKGLRDYHARTGMVHDTVDDRLERERLAAKELPDTFGQGLVTLGDYAGATLRSIWTQTAGARRQRAYRARHGAKPREYKSTSAWLQATYDLNPAC